MQFFCEQCKTKYSIPDEKVAGKILKLRCKKCNNVIVLKDPRAATASDSGPVNSGHRILQDALKRSFGEDLATMEGGMFAASPEVPEERTQIARLPDFGAASSTSALPEEWYLSDSRGQFGPMDFSELVARIKRGEPDHDAVVWRDGFDDWKLIDRVPELRAYAKHLPPPRRTTREMFRESTSFAPSATGSMVPSSVAGSPFSTPSASPTAFRNPTLDYGTAMAPATSINAMPAAIEMPMAAMRQDRMRTWMVMAGLVVVVGGVAFFLGMKLMEKPAHRTEPTPPAPVVVQTPPEAPMPAVEPPREEPMREVVYVIASPSAGSEDSNNTQSNSSTGTSTNASKSGMTGVSSTRPDGVIPETPMAAPSGSRSTADFHLVKQRNMLEIQRCYEMTVRKGQKELVGQAIKFNIRILPTGQVESVSFDGEMPPMMRSCLTGTIQKWQFPVGTKTDTYSFEMHFN